MKTNIKLWSGSVTARVTDMTNAGKRGKTCKVLRFSGVPWSWQHESGAKEEQKVAGHYSFQIYAKLIEMGGGDFNSYPHELSSEKTLDEIKLEVTKLLDEARAKGVPDYYLALYDEEIRGIAAPVEKLTAGIPGKWGAGADENGISISDLEDKFNEPAMITIRQTNFQAYKIAKKVWESVKQAKTFHEAGDILRNAGAKLHYYCRVD